MIRLSIVISFLLVTSVLAQDDEIVPEPDTGSQSDTIDDAVEDEFELDELDINTDHTEEDDDIFVPSEEVSYQQSIPFPTDI